MRISTLVKILAGLVVLIVAAIFTAILVIDPNEYKDEIIATVENQTGRDFNIESDIDLNIGLTPSFAVSGVRIANAEWGSRPEMMSVGEFAAEVALLPLIFGNLQINRLVLRDADILIETDASGRSNLDFSGTEKEAAASEGAPNLPRINDVLIENAVLTMVNGAAGTTSKFEVKRLSAKAKNLSSPLAIDVTGIATIEEQAIDFAAEGDLGAPKLLLAAGEPYPVNLTVTGLGLTAKIDGTIADLTEVSGLDLKFEVSGSDLQGLSPLSGEGLPAAGPITLAATIKGNGDNAALETIALQIGRTDIAGSVSIDMRGKRPRLEGTLHAGQIDITELMPGGEKTTNTPEAGQNSDGETPKSADGDKLFSAAPLPLDILNTFDANLDIAITQLILPGLTLADATGVLALDNGALALKPLNASLVGSAVTGDIGVDTRSGPASVSLNLKAPQLDIGELLREFANLDKLRGGGAVDVALRGTGGSVAEIMASLNGHSRMLMAEGEVKNDFLGTVSGLSQTVGEVFGKKEWIAVECIASDFEVTNGIANSRINVINTELLLITAEGKVDLGQEKPDLKVSPSPKGIDLSLAVPVNVGGTLASPTFTPDTLATAKKIGGILGAVAFPPAAIIGLGELGSSDNPCLQTAKADSPQPQPEPSEPETPVEAVTDTAKDAIEGVGKGLKKLFGN
jgi:uncharacterized protein involved in outer membrane biogenesis